MVRRMCLAMDTVQACRYKLLASHAKHVGTCCCSDPSEVLKPCCRPRITCQPNTHQRTHLRRTLTSPIPLSPPPSIVARREDSAPSVGAPFIHGTPPAPPKPPSTPPPRSAILRANPAARFLETPPRRKLRLKRYRPMPTNGSRSSVIADVQMISGNRQQRKTRRRKGGGGGRGYWGQDNYFARLLRSLIERFSLLS